MLRPSWGERSARHLVSSLPLRLALLLVPLLLLATPRDAHAYQWMLKHGYPTCGACHADPSGGELLTFYGRMQSEVTLSMPWGASGEAAAALQPGLRVRLARDPASLAAGPKLAGKNKKVEPEKVELEEDPPADAAQPEAKADAETAEAPAAEAEAAPAAAAEEDDDGLGPITPFLFGLWEPPEWLLLGGSYRHMNIITPSSSSKFRTFPMMMDVYGQVQFGSFKLGGSLGGARVPAGSPYARAAQITGNQDDAWNLISRTHYVGYEVSSALQLRAGRLNLPFGVRIPEHTMWVRQATRTDRESAQQHGISINYNADNFRFELMAIAGNYQIKPDLFRERGYAGYFEYYVTPKVVVGINSLTTYAQKDRVGLRRPMLREAHGAMLRSAVGESVALSLEADALYNTGNELGYVGFLQADWEATQGLHFMLTGEALDAGHADPKQFPGVPKVAGAGKPKLGGWLSASWWFLPHFDVRVDAIQRQGDDLSILGQLHVYL